MTIETETTSATTVAARIAGEDIARGDFVTVLNKVVELPSCLWFHSTTDLDPSQPVQYRYMPEEAGQPHKVLEICLPFVYVKNVLGKVTVFDMRRNQLVRLDPTCARQVWKEMKSQENKRK